MAEQPLDDLKDHPGARILLWLLNYVQTHPESEYARQWRERLAADEAATS
jgi:hypothetical protein